MNRVLISLAAGLLFSTSACGVEVDREAVERNTIDIREWHVPFEGRPRDPFASGEDAVWLVGQAGDYLARFIPSTGEFFKRDLDDNPGPHNLIVDSGGVVWYAGNRKGYIGRYEPKTDQITKIPMPSEEAKDPHTLVMDGDESHIWFTVQGGNFVGRLALENSAVDLVSVPTPGARPYGIKIGPDGTPWIALLGTNKLAKVDPETLELTEIEIPDTGARPRRLEITDDGRIWYSDYATGVLGMYDPASDTFKEWELPGGADARPYGTALDSHGRVWVVTGTKPNYFVGFDTDSEKIVSVTAVPSGGGTVRHMHYFEPTDSVWFGTDTQNLGRARVSIE